MGSSSSAEENKAPPSSADQPNLKEEKTSLQIESGIDVTRSIDSENIMMSFMLKPPPPLDSRGNCLIVVYENKITALYEDDTRIEFNQHKNQTTAAFHCDRKLSLIVVSGMKREWWLTRFKITQESITADKTYSFPTPVKRVAFVFENTVTVCFEDSFAILAFERDWSSYEVKWSESCPCVTHLEVAPLLQLQVLGSQKALHISSFQSPSLHLLANYRKKAVKDIKVYERLRYLFVMLECNKKWFMEMFDLEGKFRLKKIELGREEPEDAWAASFVVYPCLHSARKIYIILLGKGLRRLAISPVPLEVSAAQQVAAYEINSAVPCFFRSNYLFYISGGELKGIRKSELLEVVEMPDLKNCLVGNVDLLGASTGEEQPENPQLWHDTSKQMGIYEQLQAMLKYSQST